MPKLKSIYGQGEWPKHDGKPGFVEASAIHKYDIYQIKENGLDRGGVVELHAEMRPRRSGATGIVVLHMTPGQARILVNQIARALDQLEE